MLDLHAVWSSVEREKHRLDTEFRESWANDLRSLHDAVDTFCPKWKLKRESMLQDQAIGIALLTMKADHSRAIGPVVTEL